MLGVTDEEGNNQPGGWFGIRFYASVPSRADEGARHGDTM